MSTIPTAAPTERAHALLGASSAQKWINCPPSARLEEQFPDTTSIYAAEGTLAHSVAELHVRAYIENMAKRTFNSRLKKLEKDPLYQPEMLTHAQAYLDYIKSIVHAYDSRPHIVVEKRLDYSTFAPEGFGTGDCIIIGGSVLHVIDYKYGRGKPVSAEENPQMKLYALGALEAYAILFPVETVKLTIFQPRLENTSEWDLTAEELRNWGGSIKPIAQQAYDGQGEFCPGEWCDNGFCRARAVCRARTNTITALEAFCNQKPPIISNGEVGDILLRAQNLKSYVTALEEYALSELLAGNVVPGWKAVEGRSNRQFEDTDKAFDALKAAGYDEALLYERKPITLTAVEKLLGNPNFTELCGPFVIKPPGKPTLAPENDKRKAIANKTSAAEAFGGTENGK